MYTCLSFCLKITFEVLKICAQLFVLAALFHTFSETQKIQSETSTLIDSQVTKCLKSLLFVFVVIVIIGGPGTRLAIQN